MKIVERYLSSDHINRPGTKLDSVRSYVFHYTANESPSATAVANAKYFNRKYEWGKYKQGSIVKDGYIEFGSIQNGIGNKFRYGSTQVIADMDEIVICIPLTEKSYACGDGSTTLAKQLFNGRQNSMTINIEICNNNVLVASEDDWNGACDNAIEFVANDIVYRNTSFDYKDRYAFLRHFDVSGKLCPAPFVDLNSAVVDPDWIKFKNKLIAKIEELKNTHHIVKIPEPQPIAQSGSVYFTDVPYQHWAGPIIDKAKDYGVIKGTSPGVLGFTEDLARLIAIQMNTISLVENKLGSKLI